jgi:hypothetical protein
MFPLSGPGPSQPVPSRRPSSFQPQIQPPAAAPARPTQPALIHPGTALEFRQPLEDVLKLLPLPLLNSIARQGYCIHVIDSHGFHPLTLEMPRTDPRHIWTDPQLSLPAVLDQPYTLVQLAGEYGAVSQEELVEWCELLLHLNPHLEAEPFPPGTALQLPDLGYWFGRAITAEAATFLRQPHTLISEKPGSVAAMVTHGALPGIPTEANRILFWDQTFRNDQGLSDWYVLHELGHAVDYCYAFTAPDLWREWIAEVETLPPVTSYAATSKHELFAETFAAWARPPGTAHKTTGQNLPAQRRRSDRTALHPDAVQLVEVAVTHLIQAG